MKNKTTLFVTLLLASAAAKSEQSLLEAAGKQAAKGAVAANQALDSAKSLKQGVENAPAAVKEQARENVKAAAEEKIEQATPEELKQGAEAAKQLKGKVDAAPKSSGEALKAVKHKAKQKAAEKTLELLR